MLSSERALERCVRSLISRGKAYGGYVSYGMIGDALRSTRSDMSMENVDRVYDQLIGAGLQIVDRLPESAAARVAAYADGLYARDPLTEYPESGGMPRRRRTLIKDDDQADADDWCEGIPCPEDAIDELLLLAEADRLCSGVFWGAAEKCRLSTSEARQLAEYLWSKGVDIAGLDYFEFYQKFLVGEDFDHAREVDRFPSDGVSEYRSGEPTSQWG